MKTGIFVGSFNPPTVAHFAISQYLYETLLVDKVVFVPVNNNEKKLIDLNKRITMLNSYIKDYEYLNVSNIMENYQGNFSYHVLEELSMKYENIYVIMGSDLLEKLSTFTNYQEMLEKYHFIVVSRFNINYQEIISKKYSLYRHKFILVDYKSSISSSLVRKKIQEDSDISKLVPKQIENYIIKEGLYHKD